ncbi:MAG: glutamine synthetase III [Bacteroidales bacterium]|nr:glutamine synthetase III [Bacteroidales bacterium]MCF8336487.1 glutamine synthetase III [Bacteroidales bacterium]
MDNLRFKALEIELSRKPNNFKTAEKVSGYYGELTFSKTVMREYLPHEAYKLVNHAIDQGDQIDRKTADQVASSMKAWAIEKGATHYTHWFHPLTGSTAEKHDAFVDPLDDGKAIESFHGNQLVQQEPDASSFPSGGLRNTFEARGYTAWDPSSPAFILDATLCIPTIFIAYTGEALDYKTPLMKALSTVDSAATRVCNYFDEDVKSVSATLGWEQEYFLVDNALFRARPDLVLTGRTVFGHASAKDQQLSDHYFGRINERVMNFMQEFEYESHRLGIPVKTRHNEVAPNQFECAPVYEEANISVDHNQLIMHLMVRIAKHHNLTVLLHEKPFSKLNGSGKHNNWSLKTNKEQNLFSPGKTKEDNLRFLTFLVNTIKAVHDYGGLLRGHIASAGNDLRLGANEAPPAIISVFIGQKLTAMLDELEKGNNWIDPGSDEQNINIPKIPEILTDNTDRNRTSPFAFTGNKFEFRAVGSSESCSKPMIALNTIMAKQLNEFADKVDKKLDEGTDKNQAVMEVVKETITESKAVRFEGNSYSEEWVREAEKRGLPNIPSTPAALKTILSKEAVDLFEKTGVLNKKELEARFAIKIEKYIKKIQIEGRVIGDLAINHIIPIAVRYQNTLLENVKGLQEVLDQKTFTGLSKNQVQTIKDISGHIQEIKDNVTAMTEERKIANKMEDHEKMAFAYNEKVIPYFSSIRYHIDKLELLIDDELWPLPKYRELLFLK